MMRLRRNMAPLDSVGFVVIAVRFRDADAIQDATVFRRDSFTRVHCLLDRAFFALSRHRSDQVSCATLCTFQLGEPSYCHEI